MDNFANMSKKDKTPYIEFTANQKGLPIHIIEKDFWVCWTLKELFSLPHLAEHLIFKGGTSLSKAYKIIERFSEDIDISIDKQYLGFTNMLDPELATSNKKQQLLIKKLSEACQEFVAHNLKSALEKTFSKTLGSLNEKWKFEMDETDPDCQSLIFHYPSTQTENNQKYIRQAVKIEIGARGGIEPTNHCPISPFIEEVSPRTLKQASVTIKTLAAERTFWEKATILHMYANFPVGKSIPDRQSRHYFDFYKLLESDVRNKAQNDRPLLNRVSTHKKIFFRASWAKYDEAALGNLRLIPEKNILKSLENDYKKMNEMFYGDHVSWDKIIEKIGRFENEILMS